MLETTFDNGGFRFAVRPRHPFRARMMLTVEQCLDNALRLAKNLRAAPNPGSGSR